MLLPAELVAIFGFSDDEVGVFISVDIEYHEIGR